MAGNPGISSETTRESRVRRPGSQVPGPAPSQAVEQALQMAVGSRSPLEVDPGAQPAGSTFKEWSVYIYIY